MSSAIMNLDWCSSPTKNALLQAIRDLFTQADQNGEVGIMFSQSQAKGIINLEQRDGVLMVTRKARLVSTTAFSLPTLLITW